MTGLSVNINIYIIISYLISFTSDQFYFSLCCIKNPHHYLSNEVKPNYMIIQLYMLNNGHCKTSCSHKNDEDVTER